MVFSVKAETASDSDHATNGVTKRGGCKTGSLQPAPYKGALRLVANGENATFSVKTKVSLRNFVHSLKERLFLHGITEGRSPRERTFFGAEMPLETVFPGKQGQGGASVDATEGKALKSFSDTFGHRFATICEIPARVVIASKAACLLILCVLALFPRSLKHSPKRIRFPLRSWKARPAGNGRAPGATL